MWCWALKRRTTLSTLCVNVMTLVRSVKGNQLAYSVGCGTVGLFSINYFRKRPAVTVLAAARYRRHTPALIS